MPVKLRLSLGREEEPVRCADMHVLRWGQSSRTQHEDQSRLAAVPLCATVPLMAWPTEWGRAHSALVQRECTHAKREGREEARLQRPEAQRPRASSPSDPSAPMGSLSTSCQRARRSASALALAHRARPSVERENTRRRLHRSLLHTYATWKWWLGAASRWRCPGACRTSLR